MNHLNSLLIEGVVAQNPEAKTTNGGGQLVVFTSVSHRYTKPREREGEAWSDEAIFLDVLAWGSLGGKCMDLVEKGMTVRIVGREVMQRVFGYRLPPFEGKGEASERPAAADAFLAFFRSFFECSHRRNHFPRLFIYSAAPAEFARVMVYE